MKVRSRPGPLSDFKLETLEAAIQQFAFPAFAAGNGILGGQRFQISPDQTRQSRIPVNGDLSDLLNEPVVEREGDIHAPIIRESCNTWQYGKICRPLYNESAQ
jgi:hypothetical protein